jgi:hypothetical protein
MRVYQRVVINDALREMGNLILPNINTGLIYAFSSHRLYEKARTSHIELIIDSKTSFILVKHDILRPFHAPSETIVTHVSKHVPENRHSRDRRFVERGVPYGQQAVSQPQNVFDHRFEWLVEKVRLSALRVDVCMSAEEGRESSNLIPAHEHLWSGVAKETSYVRWGRELLSKQFMTIKERLTSYKGHASNPVRQNHLDANGHMFPCAHAITGPHGAGTLRASKKRASKDEGSLRRVRAFQNPVVGGVTLRKR